MAEDKTIFLLSRLDFFEEETIISLIQLEIDDTLIQAIGLQAVKTFMERQLTLLRVQYLGKKYSGYSTIWNKPSARSQRSSSRGMAGI